MIYCSCERGLEHPGWQQDDHGSRMMTRMIIMMTEQVLFDLLQKLVHCWLWNLAAFAHRSIKSRLFTWTLSWTQEPIVNPRTHREHPQEGGRLDAKTRCVSWHQVTSSAFLRVEEAGARNCEILVCVFWRIQFVKIMEFGWKIGPWLDMSSY